MSSKRPPNLQPPTHLTPSPPVPEPREFIPDAAPDPLDPVRYGDWEKKGVAVDF